MSPIERVRMWVGIDIAAGVSLSVGGDFSSFFLSGLLVRIWASHLITESRDYSRGNSVRRPHSRIVYSASEREQMAPGGLYRVDRNEVPLGTCWKVPAAGYLLTGHRP